MPCCGKKYQRMRMVNNRACTARPAVIVRPRSTEDVATTVNNRACTARPAVIVRPRSTE